MKIFCDTSFFIAFYDALDQYHKQAASILKIVETQKPQFYTSDYIYDETVTFLLKTHRQYGYLRAKAFDRDVIVLGEINFISITDSLFKKAREIFFRFNKDKLWSFTDCTSFAIMDDLGIKDALSFDENFKQRGFNLLRP